MEALTYMVSGSLGFPAVQIAIEGSGGASGGTYDNLPDGRVYAVATDEQPYTGRCLVVLRNNDSHFNSLDMRGSRIDIYLDGTRQQPFWCMDQRFISREGELYCELDGVSVWDILAESTGINVAVHADLSTALGPGEIGAGTARTYERNLTIEEIITSILADPNGWYGQWGLPYLGLTGGSDGIVDSYKPLILTEIGDNDRDILLRVVSLTNCVLRMSWNGMELLYRPSEASGAVVTYDISSLVTPFYAHVKGAGLQLPNRVIVANVVPNVNSGVVATYVGIAEIPESIGRVGQLTRIFADETVASDEEATVRAGAILVKISQEARQGEVLVPLNPTLKIFDAVTVTDTRGGPSVTAYAGRVERLFHSDVTITGDDRQAWLTKIQLGGIGFGVGNIGEGALISFLQSTQPQSGNSGSGGSPPPRASQPRPQFDPGPSILANLLPIEVQTPFVPRVYETGDALKTLREKFPETDPYGAGGKATNKLTSIKPPRVGDAGLLSRTAVLDRPAHMWAGVPQTSRGQQHIWHTAERFDLLGPFSKTDVDGFLKYSSTEEFLGGERVVLPAGCILQDILVGGGTMGLSIGANNFNLTGSGTIDTVLQLDKESPSLLITEPTQIGATLVSWPTPTYVWFHIIRWNGVPA